MAAQLRDGRVKGELEFSAGDDDDDELPLNFDPRGQLVEIKSAAGTSFSHLFGGETNNAVAAPLRIELPLFNFGVAANGSAKMKFKFDDNGERSFEVEVEDVSAGDYLLVVGDVVVGTVAVTTTQNGTRGNIRFEDSPEAGEASLNFDPLGQIITLKRDETVFFQRVLPVNN